MSSAAACVPQDVAGRASRGLAQVEPRLLSPLRFSMVPLHVELFSTPPGLYGAARTSNVVQVPATEHITVFVSAVYMLPPHCREWHKVCLH